MGSRFMPARQQVAIDTPVVSAFDVHYVLASSSARHRVVARLRDTQAMNSLKSAPAGTSEALPPLHRIEFRFRLQ